MPRKMTPWYEQPLTFPALLPPYKCPCCGENRESVKYGDGETIRCAECEWGECDGTHAS